jgi:pimeloyl-ACP methyl ester carboxylesterase
MAWYFITIIIICLALFLFLVFLISVSLYITKIIVTPHRYSRKEQDEFNKKQGYDKGCEVLTRTPVVFKMSDGYEINGDYCLIPSSKKFCILLHGHGTSREGAVRYSLLFHRLGYSTVIYDERSHGDNIHQEVSMGFKEAEDLSQIVVQVREKFGKDIYLGLQGVSMGGATMLLAAKYHLPVSFFVSDCAYSRLKNVIKDMVEKYHLPSFLLLPFINLELKLFHHFSFADCEPLNSIKDNKIPVLFIHGEKDNFVNVRNARELYEADKGYKELKIFPEAHHAESLTVDPERYYQCLKSFLEKVEKENKVYGDN